MSLYEDNFPFIKGSLWTGALFMIIWVIGESCTWRPPSLTWSIGCCCRCHNAALHTHKGAFTYFGLLSHSPFLLNPNKPQTSFFVWLCFESGAKISIWFWRISTVCYFTQCRGGFELQIHNSTVNMRQAENKLEISRSFLIFASHTQHFDLSSGKKLCENMFKTVPPC